MSSTKNSSHPLITVVIAVFNGAKTLEKCIDSIINQTFKNFELIIIDGNSTDDTVNILKRKSEHISYWESKKDRGIAHAWNKALKKSTGDWVLFLGSDDVIFNDDVFAEVSKLLQDNKINDIVYGKIIFGSGISNGQIIGQDFSWSKHKRRMLIPHTGCFHRRNLFTEVGNFDENFKISLDYELLLRKPSINALFLPFIITTMGGDGISSTQTTNSLNENLLAQFKNKVGSKLEINSWHYLYRAREFLSKWAGISFYKSKNTLSS